MRSLDREKQLLEVLSAEVTASVHQLADALSVSEATVRRDLQGLENRGLLRRVHGGATLEPDPSERREPLFADKEERFAAEKRQIAESALRLINDGDCIYLDGGSTVLHLARLLDRKHNLTVVTNSLSAASVLQDSPHRLIIIGGEFRSISRTLVGPLTAEMIASLHVDVAFMGTIGFTPEHGMTTTDPNEAFTKEQILHHAERKILLADASKFGVRSFARSGTADDLDAIVTNAVSDEHRDQLAKANVQLILSL